jgi:nucleotidyltransferase substrate binding protein (TIGR01987 family)
MNQDVRWIQRLSNLQKALIQLQAAVALSQARKLSDLEKQGLIQCFEFTHELAWKTMKDFLEEHGATDIYGSKDATREAFKLGIIEEGQTWMDMIKSRNQTSHIYDEETIEEIAQLIVKSYHPLLVAFGNVLEKKKEKS